MKTVLLVAAIGARVSDFINWDNQAFMITDIIIIVALILLNGVFAMAEMAVVSSRRSRLKSLAEDPSRFLSTVQIGITLIGIFSGAYSGATLAEPLGDMLTPLFGEHGEGIAVILVVVCVTYLSLVIGELVPKQLALKYAETIACLIAKPMQLLARIG